MTNEAPMVPRTTLSQEATALPKDERKRILASIPEVEFHGYLAELFRTMDPNYWVEVTHGTTELGKDIVIVRQDPLAPDVIGVVVKRGDIRAKTSGDIDLLKLAVQEVLSGKGERITSEVLSQIAQAKVHDAELRPFLARLKITKVIVVLVGEMSNTARTRIQAEVGTSGQVFDLPWLVDKFTEGYPQVFFDGRAVDFLDTAIQSLERDSFYTKAGKTLSECFVEPLVAQLDSNVALDDVSLAVQIRNKRVPFARLGEVTAQRRRVLLVGDPGSGKSKAVAKMCIEAYRHILAQLTRSGFAAQDVGIPLILPARRLLDLRTTQDLLDEVLPLEARQRFLLETLVVDGLDEVPAAERASILDRASQMALELDAHLLVTSRKLAALNAPPLGFERYELLPFEFSQAMKLVQKIITDGNVLPALREGLQRIQAQIPMSPLSLLLLVELVAERKEVPSSITELYDRFLDLVFGRWDQEKGVQVLFEYIVKKRFLAELAFHEFKEKERLEIGVADFEAFVASYSSKYGWDDAKLREFLKEIERAGILQVQDEVFFRHRSFLDYFVALFVYDQRSSIPDLNEFVARIYFDGLWSEVAFFYAGLGREVGPDLLGALFKYESAGTTFPIDKLLVGRLLQAGWHSTTKVKEDGIRAALEILPAAAKGFEAMLRKADIEAPLLYSDLFALILGEVSLGSVFLSQEVTKLLDEVEGRENHELEQFLQWSALLWSAKRFVEASDLVRRIRMFVATVEAAHLQPLEEARLLLLGGAADTSNAVLLKAISRRLKRLAKRAPGSLKPLFRERKKGFRRLKS